MPGVKKVNILGERPERIFVEFSYARLATLGVDARRTSSPRLQRQNVVTPAGSIETSGTAGLHAPRRRLRRLQKIRDTPIVARGAR